jgi:multidrug resistance efflux pump
MKAACTLWSAGSFMLFMVILLFIAVDSIHVPAVTPFNPSLLPILSEVRGYIRKSYVAEGLTVHIGDPLIELDAEELFHNKHAIKSRIHFVELGETNTRVGLAKLYRELEATQLELNSLSIISDVEGEIVLAARLSPGKKLAAGSAVAVVRKQKRR